MNWSDIAIVFRKEMLQTFRNKNTLLIMLIILLVQPIMMAAAAKLMETKLVGGKPIQPFTMIIVGEDADWLAQFFSVNPKIRAIFYPRADLKKLLPEALANDRPVVTVPPGFKSDIESATGKGDKLPEMLIYIDNRRDSSRQIEQINERLDALRETHKDARLRAAKIPDELRRPLQVKFKSQASATNRSGAIIGLALPVALVLLLLTVTLYTATDLITGERERGTLVLLMVSPASRRDILLGKMLVVGVLTALAAVMVVLLNVAILHFTVSKAFDTAGMFSFHVPIISSLFALLMAMPLVLTLTALAMAVSSYVRNYQQAQSYFSLLVLMLILPASAQLLPTGDYPPLMAAVPIANLSLCMRDVLSGQLDFTFGLVTIVSSCLYAAVLVWMATRLFDSEHSVFPQDEPASSAHGLRRILFGYLVAVFLLYFTVGQAIQAYNILPGIIVSQALLIAGPNFAFMRWMDLPIKETLGFRMPGSWRSLLAAPFLAPATMSFTGLLMFFQDMYLPAPKALEEMMINAIIPPGVPIWLVFAAIAVTPAICEEILFRGTVQRVLLKSMPPRWALVITALVFGLFHMSTFRLLPTTVLGLLFGYFSWKQNSIYPTIILHCCHNALATAMVVYHWNPMSVQGLFILAASSAVALFLLRGTGKKGQSA